MLPREMVILMAIEVATDSSKKLPKRIDATDEYISCLYNSLVRRGYLKKKILGGHQLTPQGRECFFEFLLENKTKAKAMTKMLQQLGVEASEELDKLAGQVLEVK